TPAITALSLSALVASVLTWVLFTGAVKRWQVVLSDSEISGLISAMSLLMFGTVAAFQPASIFSGWTSTAGVSTVSLAILLPAAFFAYSYSLRRNPGLAVLGQYSEPLFGTLGAVLILGEVLSARQVLGLAIIAL